MYDRYRAMLEGGELLTRAASVQDLMRQLALLMKRVLKCRLTLCYALQGVGGPFQPVGCCGLSPICQPLFLQHSLPINVLPVFAALQRKRRLLCCELPPGLLPTALVELFADCHLLPLPLMVRREPVGLACALRETPFQQEESSLLQFTASHAALAVRSLSERFCTANGLGTVAAGEPYGLDVCDRTRSMFVNTVASLVNAIEAKSTWTKGHSERVMRTSAIIAAAVGLGDLEVERVRLGGLLHDIGKIGVEGVLNNTARLLAEEDPPMKRHPEVGVAILLPIPELRAVLPGILHHHERFDGNGYPAGLGGAEIPLDARIIAVADAFDAIVSERPYKRGSGRADALMELQLCAGSQFDPQMVRCLGDFIKGDGRNVLLPPP